MDTKLVNKYDSNSTGDTFDLFLITVQINRSFHFTGLGNRLSRLFTLLIIYYNKVFSKLSLFTNYITF